MFCRSTSVIYAFGFVLFAILLISSTTGQPLDSESDELDLEEVSQPRQLPAINSRATLSPVLQRPFPRNFFLRNNWDKTPAMSLFRRTMARGANTRRFNSPVMALVDDVQAVTKRTPDPGMDDSGFSLSIMSPLDTLREKMLINVQKGRSQARNRLASNNADYLEKYG